MYAADLPHDYNAVAILEENLAQRADKQALFSAERTLTYGELAAEVNQVGNALRRLGIREGDVVALLTYDSAEWVTTFFATLKIGAIHLGVNTLLTPDEYSYILRDSKARVLVVHEALLGKITPIREGQPYLQQVVVIGAGGDLRYDEWIADEPTTLAPAVTHREDFATLNYSSGTTGEPKGILHAHKDLILTAVLWGQNILGLREEDRTFAVAKLFFTFGTGGNLLFPFSVGASIVLYPGPPSNAEALYGLIERFRPTIFYNAPTGYAMALAIPDLTERFDLSSLRLCVSAGEALPAPLWHQWKERTGLDIIDGIGATEVYHIFISNRPDDIRPGSSGRPVPGFEVRVMDETGAPTPAGEIGNLWLRGESIALSYWHQYERSKAVFRGQWFVTGDKYSVDEEGYYYHAGRSDDMLKVGGIWTSPMEVEAALISHPAVQECAVVGFRDKDELVKPKGYVVLRPGHEPSEALAAELIAHCRTQMAPYKRPRVIEFLDELPKTATGKIQRFRLRG